MNPLATLVLAGLTAGTEPAGGGDGSSDGSDESAAGAAAPRSRWSPGRRTTSAVAPSVDPDAHHPATPDGVYGRFDGNLDVAARVGTQLTPTGQAAATGLSMHYLFMAGVYAGYAHGLSRSESDRVLSLGIDMRPTFVPRWSQNMQLGPSMLDLFVDSMSLGLGVFWATPPEGSFGERRGFEASLGFGIPLMGRADGLWLGARGALRWADPARGMDTTAEPVLLLTLGWHRFLHAPL